MLERIHNCHIINICLFEKTADGRARGDLRFDLAQLDPESSDFDISIYASGVRDFCLNAYLSPSQEFK